MVFEQMLTILLGTGVGVAVVLYTVKPRQVASQSLGGSSIETFSLSSPSIDSQDVAAPIAEVTATQSAIVEAPVEEFHAISSGTVSTMTADVAAVGSSDIATVVSSPVSRSVTVGSTASAVRARRVSRRSTASPRTHARSRAASPSTRTIRRR